MAAREGIGRIANLDGVRGIAVLWVIGFHYAALRTPENDAFVAAVGQVPLLDAVLRNGYLGVDLFFLLSGFLLVLPWLTGDGGHGPGTLAFYARRARRIVPAYYVQLALLFLLVVPLLRGWDYWRRDLYVLAWNGVAHGTFLHTTSPLTSGSLGVNGALWTLAVEAQFYLLLPLIAPFIARAPLALTLVAFVLAGLWQAGARHDLAVLVRWQMDMGAHWGWPEDVVRRLLLMQLPSYLGHFALGALLARTWLRLRDRQAPPWTLPLLAVMAAGVLLHALASRTAVAGEHTWAVLAIALGTLLFAAAMASSSAAARILGSGPLAWTGKVSYSAYLYHLPLLMLFNHYAGAVPRSVAAPLYLACVMVASWGSWRFIEQRFATRTRG